MNNALRMALVATLAVATMAGCSKKVKEVPPSDTGGPADTGATTGGIQDSTPGRYGPGDLDTDSCLRQRVIYFDFDQDLLKPEFQATIACHTKYRRDRP
jgi:peptidoglycan-associated lipoprotein